jgi:hypothetical protein
LTLQTIMLIDTSYNINTRLSRKILSIYTFHGDYNTQLCDVIYIYRASSIDESHSLRFMASPAADYIIRSLDILTNAVITISDIYVAIHIQRGFCTYYFITGPYYLMILVYIFSLKSTRLNLDDVNWIENKILSMNGTVNRQSWG